MQKMGVRSLGREDPSEKEVANPLQCSCLENPHGQRSLVGHSPRVCKESDTTECLTLDKIQEITSQVKRERQHLGFR